MGYLGWSTGEEAEPGMGPLCSGIVQHGKEVSFICKKVRSSETFK